jgi:MinD superfamily P-loop ATPase
MGTTDHFGVPSVVAINKADLNLDRCREIAVFCAERNVGIVGEIPYDTIVTRAMVQGQPVTEYADGPVTQALHALWSQVKAQLLSDGTRT